MSTDVPAGRVPLAARSGAARAPGFDGLRALAVLAVMAFHERAPALPGGFLGVDVFFVLSGYLITDLLVACRDRHGRLDLRGFWARRARRLLPALAVVLAVVTAGAAVIEPDQLGQLRPSLLAAVTYSSNWWQAWQHQSYFTALGPPPPLRHLWSLAIEEQFYLVWPLILALLLAWPGARMATRHGRRVRAAVAWAGAAGSALAMAAIYVPGADPSRVYYGTDTHATALLVGAALALTWPLTELRAAQGRLCQRLDLAGVIGIAVLAWAAGHFAYSDAALYPAGLLIAALASGAVVMSAATSGTVAGLLAWAPLRWLGRRSYGVYLWHWPVIALAVAVAGPGPQNAWMSTAETAATIALAAASWRWIEAPILRDGFRPTVRRHYRALAESVAAARRSPARGLPALILAAALSVACTAGYRVLRAPASTALEMQLRSGEKVSQATRAEGGRAQPGGPGGTGIPWQDRPSARAAALPRQAGVRVPGKATGAAVTAIGDSVMLAAAPELRDSLHGVYIDARVSRQMAAGVAAAASLAGNGTLRQVVVVALGTNGTVTGAQIRQLLAVVGRRRELVLVNVFVPRPWEHGDNAVLAAAARRHPNVVLADWRKAIAGRTSLLWNDRMHPRPPGARLYARVVAAAVRTALAHQGRQAWRA